MTFNNLSVEDPTCEGAVNLFYLFMLVQTIVFDRCKYYEIILK